MDILVFIKELLANRELVGMFLTTFLILSIATKNPALVAKVLRKPLIIYVIIVILLTHK